MKQTTIFAAAALAVAAVSTPITNLYASECGLSCCIAAGLDGGSNNGFAVSVQQDVMRMKTIKSGTQTITAAQALALGQGAISTNMVMQKTTVNMSYRPDQDNMFLLSVPYITNDMDMRMGATYSTMDTIRGKGDISLTYVRDVYKDADTRTRQRVSLGFGVKAPTGEHKIRSASNQELVHMMMQPGTGAWDMFAVVNGVTAFGEHEDGGAQWLLVPSLMYHKTGRNDLGYKVGDKLNYDLSTRYRVTSTFNAKMDLNGIWAGRDSALGWDAVKGHVAYQRNTIIDRVDNTGLNSVFISPGFQWVLGDGWNVSGEYRLPLYQNVTGTQQVTDSWWFLRVGASF